MPEADKPGALRTTSTTMWRTPIIRLHLSRAAMGAFGAGPCQHKCDCHKPEHRDANEKLPYRHV